MLTLSQVAKYNKLREQCLIHNVSGGSSIVPTNQFTSESVKCTSLPELPKATETYIKWILELPLHMCMSDRKAIAKSVAKTVCLHYKRLASQRETIKQ